MSILVLLVALVQFGCRQPPPPNEPAGVVRSPVPQTRREDVLSHLLVQNLKTAGTLREDHDAAKEYLEAQVNHNLLAKFKISPVSYLINGYDRAYRAARNNLSSNLFTPSPSPPRYLSKYMLFCRFIHNAAQVDPSRDDCQYQLIRDANEIMHNLGRRGRPIEFDQFKVVLQLCFQMELSRDCPSYALEASLAIDGVRMDRPKSADLKQLMNLILDSIFREIGTLWISCPEKRAVYKQYVTKVIETARRVILPPPTATCTDDLVESTRVKLNEIDLEFRNMMEC